MDRIAHYHYEFWLYTSFDKKKNTFFGNTSFTLQAWNLKEAYEKVVHATAPIADFKKRKITLVRVIECFMDHNPMDRMIEAVKEEHR